MAGWRQQLDGHESEWTPGVGDEQGGLACCNSWGRKESDTTERLNWTEYSIAIVSCYSGGQLKRLHWEMSFPAPYVRQVPPYYPGPMSRPPFPSLFPSLHSKDARLSLPVGVVSQPDKRPLRSGTRLWLSSCPQGTVECQAYSKGSKIFLERIIKSSSFLLPLHSRGTAELSDLFPKSKVWR